MCRDITGDDGQCRERVRSLRKPSSGDTNFYETRNRQDMLPTCSFWPRQHHGTVSKISILHQLPCVSSIRFRYRRHMQSIQPLYRYFAPDSQFVPRHHPPSYLLAAFQICLLCSPSKQIFLGAEQAYFEKQLSKGSTTGNQDKIPAFVCVFQPLTALQCS